MFPPIERIRPRVSDGLVALGGDLHPDTLIEAYRKGIFPWDGRQPIPWYSPDPRLILEPTAFRASQSLRKLDRQRKLIVRFDTAFREVMVACAVVPRQGQQGSWITPELVRAYGALHDAGVGHSVEAWTPEGELVGGLYGLALGRAFFGESMFAARPDASKLALLHLTAGLTRAGYHFVDCQQDTPHLRSLGAVVITRADYLDRLARALDAPDAWAEVRADEG
jgi:leucyl/phenylalanyl-tRNA--protein transferase